MASCHLVAKVGDRYIGDPLDIEMFKDTHWVIDETETTNHTSEISYLVSYYPTQVSEQMQGEQGGSTYYKIGTIKRFDFSSALQCMSVITRNDFEDVLVGFVKGSPEKIASISLPHTVPKHFDQILKNYTQDGLRVLGLSYKYLPNVSYEQAQNMERADIE